MVMGILLEVSDRANMPAPDLPESRCSYLHPACRIRFQGCP